jgi:hypothetical protein
LKILLGIVYLHFTLQLVVHVILMLNEVYIREEVGLPPIIAVDVWKGGLVDVGFSSLMTNFRYRVLLTLQSCDPTIRLNLC